MPLGYYTPSAAIIKNRSISHSIPSTVSGDSLLPHGWCLSTLPHMVEGRHSKLYGNSHNLMDYEGSFFMTSLLSKSSTCQYHNSEVRIFIWGFEGDTSIQGITVSLWTSPC